MPTVLSEVAGAEVFTATHWSVVVQARHGSPGRREALERLCSSYWLPIYAYLRRCGHSPADSEDLTQGFFVHLIESDFLDRSDPARGRFRGYIIAALKRFLGDHFERQGAKKRGGGVEFVDWNCIDAEGEFELTGGVQSELDPSAAYERHFAQALMSKALRRLEEEQVSAGKSRQFAALKTFLGGAPGPGGYELAARELGTTRANVAVWVHRLNQRYTELIKLEVADAVEDPAEAKDELRHLLETLASNG